MIKVSLLFELLRNHTAIFPKRCFECLLTGILVLLALNHSKLPLLPLNNLMRKTILFVVPHSIGCKIQTQGMRCNLIMFAGISIFVPAAADNPTNHTNPIIFLFWTFLACCLNLRSNPTNQARWHLHILLFWFSIQGNLHSGNFLLEDIKAKCAKGNLYPNFLLGFISGYLVIELLGYGLDFCMDCYFLNIERQTLWLTFDSIVNFLRHGRRFENDEKIFPLPYHFPTHFYVFFDDPAMLNLFLSFP